MIRIRLPILLIACTLVAACSPDRAMTRSDSMALGGAEKGVARGMYFYTQARLHAIDGDFDGAFLFMKEAMEADPSAAFLQHAMAQLLAKQNRLAEALTHEEKAIALDPSMREAQLTAGTILATLKREREALPYLRKAVELDPAKEDAYIHLAVANVRLFEYEAAVATLKDLLKASPDSFMGYYYLARTYDQMKLYRESINYYNRALDIRPEFEQAILEMGVAQEAAGLHADAIASFQRALKQNPANSMVRQHLTQLLIHDNRLDDAARLLKEQIDSGAGNLEHRRKLGLVCLELERYAEAIEQFGEILRQEPNAHQIRFYLATAYEEQQKYDQALEEFARIPATAFNYVDAIGRRATLHREKGEPEKGIALLQDAIRSNPVSLDLHLYLAGMYEASKRYADGLTLLQEMEAIFPKEPRILFRKGVMHDKAGNRPASIAALKQVLALSPDDVQALNYLGYTYAEMGTNLEEALQLLKRAVQLRPNDGFILDSLGWIYFKLKRYEEAQTNLERARELSPEDSTVTFHLAEALLARKEYRKALVLYKLVLKEEPGRADVQDRIRRIKGELGE